MQGSQFMVAPNAAYDSFTGYAPGQACSTRDLVLDVHAALARRGLELMLYWTGDGPHLDPKARHGLGWPDSPGAPTVPDVFLQRWSAVLEEYAARYAGKVRGWWIDGCYASAYNYTQARLQPYHDAIRRGNPEAILCDNNGVVHPINTSRTSPWQDFACGESNTFVDVPTQRFFAGPDGPAQWHTLINLGPQWCVFPGCCLPAAFAHPTNHCPPHLHQGPRRVSAPARDSRTRAAARAARR